VSVAANVIGQDAFRPAFYTEALWLCLAAADFWAIKVVVLPFSSVAALDSTETADFADAVAALRAAGINIVAAAGGTSGGPVQVPANGAGVLSVGAVDAVTGGRCGFSATGADLFAPGCRLDGARPSDGSPTTDRQGTDVAAVLVATALAALRSWRPDLTADAAEDLLQAAARSGGSAALDVVGIFAAAGLSNLTGWQSPPPASTVTNVPAVESVPLAARIAIDGKGIKRLSTARTVRLTGRLTGPDGQPVPAATVIAETRNVIPKSGFVSGPRTPLTTSLTDADGRFGVLVPKGASRAVVLRYEGTTTQVNVLVPAQISARPVRRRLRNGERVTIRGRVAGPIPDGGAPIALEARNRGSWVPVATTRRLVKTSNSGHFTLSYRFLRTYAATSYRFRVVADEDSSFPYTRGASRTIRVHVRP
jgi:hypothetical protein